MAYNPTTWKDQIVTDPTKYKITKENGTEELVNIQKAPGEIVQEGTRITAEKLNNIEQGIEGAADLVGDLAGVGREEETVKKNADDIGRVSALMADLTSTEVGKGASKVSIHDADGNFTATDVEGALSELFTNVSDGKQLIATAITDKGVSTSGSDSFNMMANNIGNINTEIIQSVKHGQVLWERENNTTIEEKIITIPFIDSSNSIILVSSAKNSGSGYTGDNLSDRTIMAEIIDNTHIKLSRSARRMDVRTNWTVLEFNPDVIQSIQKGIGKLTSYYIESSVPISNINTSKSFVIFSSRLSSNDTDIGITIRLSTNSMNICGSNYRVSWQIVEFK